MAKAKAKTESDPWWKSSSSTKKNDLNMFIDKRIGEIDDTLQEFNKAVLRLQRERQQTEHGKLKENLFLIPLFDVGSFLCTSDAGYQLAPRKMVRNIPERLLGDDDAIAIDDIKDDLQSLVETLSGLLRPFASLLGLSPDDDDDDDDRDLGKSRSNAKWAHLGLTLFLPVVVAVLYRYCRSRCNEDSDTKKKGVEPSSSSSSSSETLPEEKPGWFSKYRMSCTYIDNQ